MLKKIETLFQNFFLIDSNGQRRALQLVLINIINV